MSRREPDSQLRVLVAQVASAYFSSSPVSLNDISQVIRCITESLLAVPVEGLPVPSEPQARNQSAADPARDAEDEMLRPSPAAEPIPSGRRRKATAAQIRASIRPDALVSFEDGQPYKSLRRHIAARGLTPDDYRKKWGLPDDYPMVCQQYRSAPSTVAKALGLGRAVRLAGPARRGAPRSGSRAK